MKPLELLEREITELASQIHAQTCRWLGLVAEYDEREGWAQWGCRSCAHWVSWRCGVSPEAAREHVRVARRLRELPLIREAFGRGQLSYSKVRALTRVEGVEREQELLDLARHASAAQLERLLRAYRGVVAVEHAAAGGRPARWVMVDRDDDGSVLLRARLPAEEGELVLAALEAARERVGEGVSAETPDAAGHGTAAVREAGGVSAETRDVAGPGVVGSDDHEGVSAETSPRSAAELRADALVVMADAVLANGPAARSGGDRYQVVVHVDAPNLRGERGGRCETADGAPVAAETARRLACDASIVTMLEGDGTALNVGRKTRSIPPALRRALAARDRGCCFPGCTARRFVDAHHIEHWAHGGETKLGNLVQVCRHHHRLLHEGGYGVARERDGRLVFRRPDGRLIAACPAPPGARPGAAREWSRVDPEACVPLSAGDRLDLDLGVEAMLAFAPIRAGEPLGV